MQRFVVVLGMAACGGGNHVEVTPVIGTPIAADAAVADAEAPEPWCLRHHDLAYVTGPGAIACFDEGQTVCFQLDSLGDTTYVPTVPAPMTTPSADIDETEIIVPAGWQAAVKKNEADEVTGVELCKGSEPCIHVPLPKTKQFDLTDYLATIALSPDAKTLWIDRGMALMSRSQVEVYDVSGPKPRLLRTVAIPQHDCTNIEAFLDDDTVLLQGADCANAGGERAIASMKGHLRARLRGSYAFGQKYIAVAPHRWVFVDSYDLELWDTKQGKRLARIEADADAPYNDAFALVDDTLFVIAENGEFSWFDRDLEPLGSARIPSCDDSASSSSSSSP